MTSFHVRHNFTPALAREALLLLKEAPAQTVDEVIERARTKDLELGRRGTADKVVASLRDLGLLAGPDAERRSSLVLSALGKCLLQETARDHLLFAEYIHIRYWWLWALESGSAPYSWAYRFVATLLWEHAPTEINTDVIVALVLAAAKNDFDVDDISFSSSSVLGILHWLRALSPPVVVSGGFQRRFACPPESMALALHAVGAGSGRTMSGPAPIDAPTKQTICQCLLLDPAAFEEMIAHAEDSLDLVRHRTNGHDLVRLQQCILPGLVCGRDSGCRT